MLRERLRWKGRGGIGAGDGELLFCKLVLVGRQERLL